MCVVPLADHDAHEACGEDEAPPIAQTPNKKKETNASATPVALAPAPKKALRRKRAPQPHKVHWSLFTLG